ncbi:MAG TPA: 50S ribosomal protein L25 [Candidatus Binataceae bacterium]|nr:50S ribosomal protein L25 [Candidatus Binataceae bacterium]
MMDTPELVCEKRATRPKGQLTELRQKGRIPGVMYGAKGTSVPVAVDAAELRSGMAGTSRQRLIRLKSAAPELNERHIILKEIQRAPVSGKIIHVDFYEVDMSKPLRLSVPLKFTGRAAGIIDGGILQPLVREVEVECPPLEIPEFIDVDVTPLGIHDVIHISALKFSGNVKPLYDSDLAVVSVLPPTVAEAPVAAAAPEVTAEGAPVEGAAAPAAGGAAPAAAGSAPAAAPAKQ